ncbi:helix-turn-helix transcriptional regulator [Streptomyces sp. NPDC001904]|uniref:helix-turn-helix transcriptional regulator n=1 Tax=Streptomyces sp. NPDC001904 TaxID=3154531 RepID=UPI00332BC337
MAPASTHSEGAELGRYLRARRTQTSPARVGLTVGTGVRRTPGLRREELATLAGISIDYYVRLERGKETRPSPAVLDSLARALHMDDQEHQHAYVISRSMDVLAWNPGGLALYAGLEDWPAKHRNLARYLFLHPAARDLFPDWDRQVTGCVARLRAVAGTAPDAPDLTALVGELLLKSPDFAGLWERYEVTGRKPAQKTFRHPRIGTVTLTSQSLHIEGTPGRRIGVYTAEPGSPEHDALVLLDMTAPRPAEPSAAMTETT